MSYLKLRTGAAPSTPPAGAVEYWTSTDKRLHFIDETGAQGTVGGGPSNWVNVTQQATPVLTTNTAAQNVTAINAILAAASNGQTIYFPSGTYSFNAAWTMPAIALTFRGEGTNGPGGFTNLQWTTNVAGTLITLSALHWYTNFINLSFSTSVNQTAGYVVDTNGNVSINFYGCTFQGASASATLSSCIGFTGTNGGNTTIVDTCNFSVFSGVGVDVDSNGASLVVVNSVISGQWGTATQTATAGLRTQRCGALQVDNCDLIGATNNMLLTPGSSQVTASVQVNNTYMDNANGSCLKITGAGATVRSKFNCCTFTTSSATTGLSAVEISTTVTAGAQGIDFINCNVLNTFATTGTTNGFLITGAADFSIIGCRIAGWTNGIQMTPWTTAASTIAQILNNILGSTGGYGVNTVGILLNAGAATYGALEIIGNDLNGNTTPVTNNLTTNIPATASRYRIMDNAGHNPRGAVTTPAVPASTATATNTTGYRINVIVKLGTTAPTALTINGVSATAFIGALSTIQSFVLDPGGTVSFTYVAAPTWVWVGN